MPENDTSNLDFLADLPKEETGKETIKRITDKVLQMQILDSEIESLNAKLQEKEKQYTDLNQREIPELMLSNGLSQLTLADGKTSVKIDDDITVSIPKDENGNKIEDFYNWLSEHNEDDIIKLNFAFDKMESFKIKALYAFLNALDYKFTSERGIHPQTLKKYIKVKTGFGLDAEEVKNGLESGKIIPRETFDSLLNMFIFHITKVKNLK